MTILLGLAFGAVLSVAVSWALYPKKRLQRRAGIVVLALTPLAAIGAIGASMATASPASVPRCPAPMTCTYKPQMIIDTVPGTDGHSQWAVADGYGAPIAWVNGVTAGFYFLGDGNGRERICITYELQAGHEAACLLSDGRLELRATGPGGSLGPPQFLTASRLGQLLALDSALRTAGITSRDLLMLGRWLHATGR